MQKYGIDQQGLINMFADATAKQGEQVRKTVYEATLKALQGRELTLQNIRTALKSVTQAINAGAAKNALPEVDVEAMIGQAIGGMDDALLKAVEANRVALERFVDQGVSLQDQNLKKAVDTLEKMEDTLIKSVSQAMGNAGENLAGPWSQVLGKMQASGTNTGAQASQTVEQLASQMQNAVRETRAASLKAAQTMTQGYATLVSGVLIGMSDALKQGSSGGAAAAKKKTRSS